MKEVITKKLKQSISDIQLERLLASYLNKNLTSEEIFENIKENYDLESVVRFLYNSKSYKKILKFSKERLKNNQNIPWSFVLPLVLKSHIEISPAEVNILYHTWLGDYLQNHPRIFTCSRWENYSQEFAHHLNIFLKDLKEAGSAPEDQSLQTLEFVKAQNLMEEESKIIKNLLKKDKDNLKYQELYKSLKERQAIKVIEDQKKSLYKSRISNQKPYLFLENTETKNKWYQKTEKLAKQRPDLVKNLSLFLYFLHWPDMALKILTKNLEDLSDYWLYLDCLLETGQYTKSLDLTNQLLEQIQDSEMVFPLIYIKSQSLYYLGKKEEAIEHLDSILKVRPDYRSAQSLLEKWTRN
ncbi:MAG: hypothetical protein ACR2M7_01600 [Bdellovibrionales bacterium]